jgi:hypothetical protein
VPVVRCHIDRLHAAQLSALADTETGTVAEAVAPTGSESDIVSQALTWSVGYLKQRSSEEELMVRREFAAAQEDAALSARALEATSLRARQRAMHEAMARASAKLPSPEIKSYR